MSSKLDSQNIEQIWTKTQNDKKIIHMTTGFLHDISDGLPDGNRHGSKKSEEMHASGSDAVFNSKCQFSNINDDFIQTDDSQFVSLPIQYASEPNKLSIYQSSQSISLPNREMLSYQIPQICCTPDCEYDETREQNADPLEDSQNYEYKKVDGLVLPIDDNEFAIVDPVCNDKGFSFEVFSTQSAFLKHNNVQKTRTAHERANSFTNFQSLKPSLVDDSPGKRSTITRPQSRRNSAEYGKMSSVTIPLNFKSRSASYSNDCASDNSISSMDSHRSVDSVKDKTNSIFETNGLFIKKDHPLFTQTYSRKVFVGGLPRDITIDNIQKRFSSFGALHVDWPNRENESVPPNGFAFLHFDQISSVEKLYEVVGNSKNKNKYTISSQTMRSKDVEIKFWKMNDCEYLAEEDVEKINPSFTVFVGALPRITTAIELASFMENAFSDVVYAAIDVDTIFGYPKGAGRVTFRTKESFTKALDSHFVDMDIGHIGKKKRIEIKPFLLNDQKCDICAEQRLNQPANKYCYRCESFICEECEFNRCCVNGNLHNLIGRSNSDTANYNCDF